MGNKRRELRFQTWEVTETRLWPGESGNDLMVTDYSFLLVDKKGGGAEGWKLILTAEK